MIRMVWRASVIWESIKSDIIHNDNFPSKVKIELFFNIIREVFHTIDDFCYDWYYTNANDLDKDTIKIRVYHYGTYHKDYVLKNPKKHSKHLIQELLNLRSIAEDSKIIDSLCNIIEANLNWLECCRNELLMFIIMIQTYCEALKYKLNEVRTVRFEIENKIKEMIKNNEYDKLEKYINSINIEDIKEIEEKGECILKDIRILYKTILYLKIIKNRIGFISWIINDLPFLLYKNNNIKLDNYEYYSCVTTYDNDIIDSLIMELEILYNYINKIITTIKQTEDYKDLTDTILKIKDDIKILIEYLKLAKEIILKLKSNCY